MKVPSCEDLTYPDILQPRLRVREIHDNVEKFSNPKILDDKI